MTVVPKEVKRFNGKKKRLKTDPIAVYRCIQGFPQEEKIDLCYVASVSKGWNYRDRDCNFI